MKKLAILGLMALLALPASGLAAGEDAVMQELQKQIQKLSAELDDLSDRLDAAEKHASTDRIEFSGDLRYKVHSLHYGDVTFNPGITVDYNDFGSKVMGSLAATSGFHTQLTDAGGNPLTFYTPGTGTDADMLAGFLGNNNLTPLTKMLIANPNFLHAFVTGQLPSGVAPYPFVAMPTTNDINNDILQTTRLRLNMSAKVANNVKFSGRLSMFKNWGDSTGAQVFDSWDRFTMDATDSTNTTGDMVRVDRAYFDWSNIADSGFYLSIGRRPSTGGPPLHFRANELRGGTPTGNVMSLNFDGITVGRNLEDWTGIEGMVARFCYGQGYESEWGNGEMFNEIVTKDTHFAGFNVDVLNDGTNFLQVTAFRAMDINDGFKGIIAFPTQYAKLFAPTMYGDMQNFPTFNFVTRVQPSTTIGDIDLGGIVFTRNEENGVNWFVSGGMTILHPNNNAGMFGGMGSDAIYVAELNDAKTDIVMKPQRATDTDDEEGYGFYAGLQVPAPSGKFGLEYSYGSKWWTPFSQAVDDPLGSKLSTRGHTGEAYYIFDINPNMFIKLSGIYYDFNYTGSGSPVGAPKKIDDVKDGTAYSLMPVVESAYDVNATFTVKF